MSSYVWRAQGVLDSIETGLETTEQNNGRSLVVGSGECGANGNKLGEMEDA